ncbi:MAG: chemotaxis-specific protein-glutamate methyltransferase CheB [Acidobacteriota bacterium]|nr:MAG: chemotaxis-specific protein-glutamate methyltransferase CheB [Acidobacteriota bacterium]
MIPPPRQGSGQAERNVRVLIADDTAFNRKILSEMLSRTPGVEVVGTAYDGQVTIKRIEQLQPDVLTLDLEMPALDGFSVLRWVMANRPLPVIVVSSHATDKNVFKALDLGAVDFIAKPGKRASVELHDIEVDLAAKVLAAASAHLKSAVPPPAQEPPSPSLPPPPLEPPPIPVGTEGEADVVLIGSSTGGPTIIQQSLAAFPENLPVSVLVAQHMPPIFTNLFASRLDRACNLTVREAEDGDAIEPGHAYVAPGGKRTTVAIGKKRPVLRVHPKNENDRFAPSISHLFQSAAETLGISKKLLGVILTGMSGDGRQGVEALKKADGTTVVESPETATVRSMPEEIIRAGLADVVCSAENMAVEILKRCRGPRR